MLATRGNSQLALEGTNQQDFKEIQLVAGAYPYQMGLQKRVPGKSLQRIIDGPVSAIYVFYNVFGRAYVLTDFGSLQIDEVVIPPISLPGLPALGDSWYDTFAGYTDGVVSRIWGGGLWVEGNPGICETLIEGIIDPFLVYAEGELPPGRTNPNISERPVALGTPDVDPSTTPVDTGSSGYLYPPGTEPDIILHKTLAQANNSCTGQGTQPVPARDLINYRVFSGSPILDALNADGVTVGARILWHGITVGRDEDSDIGLVVGTCPGPPWPEPTVYYVHEDETFGQES